MVNYQADKEVQKRRWWILVAVSMFTFMSTLDASIVNIALPTISADMQVAMNQVEWVVSIYLMVVCACLLLFGKIGDSWGKIKIFRLGMLIFTVGSLLCGFNQSLQLLLFARVIQAIGASMTMATNTGIITEVFPMNERGRALGMIGAFVSLGSIAGPGLGGLILAQFSWSYIFWLNVPVGILTMIAGERVLPKDLIKNKNTVIDKQGFCLFSCTILAFFGWIFIGQEQGFSAVGPTILLLVAIVSFAAFILVEKRTKEPLIDFKIFQNKVFSLSLLTALLIFAANFFVNVVIPFYLQDARGLDASYAGLLMMVFPLMMVIGSPISGYLTDRIGPKILVLAGLILLSCTQVMYMFMDQQSSILFYVIATAIMGLGNALFQSPNNTMVMSSVDKKNLGVAGSLNSFARNFGMVLGISLATTILYQGMSQAYGQHVTTYIEERPDIFIYGLRLTFFGSFLLCLFALVITVWRFKKDPRKSLG